MSRILIHKSPLGPLSIPGVLGDPEPGEPFEVDDDIAETLLEQSDLYAPFQKTELTAKDLRKIASERGVDLTGARTKPEIAAAIARHDEPTIVGTVDEQHPAADTPEGSIAAFEPQEGGDQQ